MTTVLFSSSKAGSSIFKTANIGRLTFLIPLSRQEIHEKSTKNGEYQCTVTPSCTGQKLMKYKFNLYFTFEINNIHNRSCRKLFFLPLLNPLFHYSNLQKVFNWPCTSQKTLCSHQNLFFLQNKGLNNPICIGRHTKNNIRLFKLDSKTLLVYQSAIMSTKWRNMKATPTLILLEDISIKIIERGLLQSYLWLST